MFLSGEAVDIDAEFGKVADGRIAATLQLILLNPQAIVGSCQERDLEIEIPMASAQFVRSSAQQPNAGCGAAHLLNRHWFGSQELHPHLVPDGRGAAGFCQFGDAARAFPPQIFENAQPWQEAGHEAVEFTLKAAGLILLRRQSGKGCFSSGLQSFKFDRKVLDLAAQHLPVGLTPA
ncbi:MAG: hypothetical protein ACR2Q4_19720 [Geminicoccaceae bacterium]